VTIDGKNSAKQPKPDKRIQKNEIVVILAVAAYFVVV